MYMYSPMAPIKLRRERFQDDLRVLITNLSKKSTEGDMLIGKALEKNTLDVERGMVSQEAAISGLQVSL